MRRGASVVRVMMTDMRRFLVLCAVGATLLTTQSGNSAIFTLTGGAWEKSGRLGVLRLSLTCARRTTVR